MNWKHLLVALVFFVFGILQFNDSDPWLWVVAYGILAFAIYNYAKGNWVRPIFFSLAIIYFIAALFFTPEIYKWYQDGFPSILDSMKAENPQIEWVREFFGLALCSLVSLAYYTFHRAKNI